MTEKEKNINYEEWNEFNANVRILIKNMLKEEKFIDKIKDIVLAYENINENNPLNEIIKNNIYLIEHVIFSINIDTFMNNINKEFAIKMQ